MAVLSLIVVGFAQLARREQREAFDKQLSTQAFYAAESGINDAMRKIDDGTLTDNKTTCDPGVFNTSKDLDSSASVSYTCLLIDRTPSRLEYGAVEVDQSTVVPLNPVNTSVNPFQPQALSSLDVSWNKDDNGGSGYFYDGSNNIALPAAGNGSGQWGDREAGVLRVDLIPADGGLSRDNLANRMFTVFLYPGVQASDPSSVNYQGNAGGVGGNIQRIKCSASNTPRKCKARIIIPAAVSDKHYYIRMTSIYSNSKVTISALDTLNRQVSFEDGQYVIDSTGRAGDVLKRVRVHKSAGDTDYRYPTYAINSVQNICKRLEVYPARPAQGSTPAIPGFGDDSECTP